MKGTAKGEKEMNKKTVQKMSEGVYGVFFGRELLVMRNSLEMAEHFAQHGWSPRA